MKGRLLFITRSAAEQAKQVADSLIGDDMSVEISVGMSVEINIKMKNCSLNLSKSAC